MARILFVDFDLFEPAVTGARQRSALLHDALSQCGEVDTLVAFTQPRDISSDLERMPPSYRLVGTLNPPPPAGQTGLWRHVSPVHPKLIQKLAHNLRPRESLFRADGPWSAALRALAARRRYGLIVARYLRNAAQAGVLDYGTAIVDADDFDSEVVESKSAMPGVPLWRRMVLRRHAEAYRQVEARLLSRCGGVFVTKESDLERMCGAKAVVLPNIPYAEDGAAKALPLSPMSKTMVFVGSLRWVRNIEAVDFFVARVLPDIRRWVPGAKFRIVGTGLEDEDRRRWSRVEGVEVWGEVDDIRDAYRDAAFSVAPMLAGGGTNIKVLESLAYNRVCVGTDFAMRGFETVLKNGISIVSVGNPREMADACCQLLKNPKVAAWMARNGRDIVRTRFSRQAFRSAVRDLVEEVLWQGRNDGDMVRRRISL
jgi:glycosyltransferase involved in cell wall biosynthesis